MADVPNVVVRENTTPCTLVILLALLAMEGVNVQCAMVRVLMAVNGIDYLIILK